jgi:hypothetical protein
MSTASEKSKGNSGFAMLLLGLVIGLVIGLFAGSVLTPMVSDYIAKPKPVRPVGQVPPSKSEPPQPAPAVPGAAEGVEPERTPAPKVEPTAPAGQSAPAAPVGKP